MKSDPLVAEFAVRVTVSPFNEAEIGLHTNPGGPGHLGIMPQINDLLDASIVATAPRFRRCGKAPALGMGSLTSAIGFAALAKRFEKTHPRNVEVERLMLAVRAQAGEDGPRETDARGQPYQV